MSQTQSHQIGFVSEKTGLSVHTIRYYEKLGLIRSPKRSGGGFRLYPDKEIEKLLFIQKAQSFGLTLEEIRKIIGCSEQGINPCCDLITEVFSEKIKEFESKISELQQMRRRLKRLISGWSSHKEE